MDWAVDYRVLIRFLAGAAALISSYVHLELGFRIGLSSYLGPSFVFAGFIFILGLFLEYKGYLGKLGYFLGFWFVFVQIVLWYVINGISLSMIPGALGFWDLLDKSVQLVLVLLLSFMYLDEE